MKSVLIGYFSVSGHTAKMAEYIAEGIRAASHKALVQSISELKEPGRIEEYDGIILGCPTYNRDIPDTMRKYLGIIMLAKLAGKPGGTFGSYTHDGNAPALLLDIMQNNMKVEPFELGAFNLLEDVLNTQEGLKACHDYGRVFGDKL